VNVTWSYRREADDKVWSVRVRRCDGVTVISETTRYGDKDGAIR
jgi:hypothetical protein